jgi:hypothetical protein
MPDVAGVFTLVPSYFAVEGATIEVANHNPVLEDIATALTNRLSRNGSAPMTGNLNAGSNKITSLAAATNPGDAARFDQTVFSAFLSSASALSLLANEMIYASGVNVAAKTVITAFARSLLDDVDAAAARVTIDAQQLSGNLTGVAALTDPGGNRVLGWDDTANAFVWFTAGQSMSLAANAVASVGYACRAWVTFTGATGAVTGSANVDSVTRSGAGIYTVNFTDDAPNINYVPSVLTDGGSIFPAYALRLVGSCQINTRNNVGTLVDPASVSAAFFW